MIPSSCNRPKGTGILLLFAIKSIQALHPGSAFELQTPGFDLHIFLALERVQKPLRCCSRIEVRHILPPAPGTGYPLPCQFKQLGEECQNTLEEEDGSKRKKNKTESPLKKDIGERFRTLMA